MVSKHTKYANHYPRSIFHFSLHGTGYKKLVFAFVPHDVWLFWGHFQAMEGLHARWNLTALVCSAELTSVCEIRIEFNSLSFFFFSFCYKSYFYSFYKTLGFYLDLYNKVVALFEYYFCLLYADAVSFLSAVIFYLHDFIVWVCVCVWYSLY